ncbi:MAG: enoyl-CoA hydratase-related protein, partial [Phenylobacterium sp.]
MSNFETIRLEVEDGIATLTLNRPDKLNAFNTQMMQEMIAAFDQTDADDSVRVVIVTGAGRAFCAGADLSAGAATFDYSTRAGHDHHPDAVVGVGLVEGGDHLLH